VYNFLYNTTLYRDLAEEEGSICNLHLDTALYRDLAEEEGSI
jgi:hypothetical protein